MLALPVPATAATSIVDISAAAGIRDVTNTWSAEAGDIDDDPGPVRLLATRP